jgi:hypothetical protein
MKTSAFEDVGHGDDATFTDRREDNLAMVGKRHPADLK